MKLLVITQSRGRSGRLMQQRREVTADWIRVGRAASSEILLADPRIALNQGLLIDRGGLVYTEGESGVVGASSTTRKAVSSVRMSPGVAMDVGPYRFTSIAPPAGFDAALTVEMLRPLEGAPEGIRERARQLTLASLGIPKRGLAWALFAVVATVFFLVPASRVLGLPWHGASQQVLMASDRFWNPGPVILAHQPIEQKCAACHEVAFEHVKDTACMQCHAKIGHHLEAAARPAGLFDGQRCTTCHRDHKGAKTTHRDDDRFCVACHRDVRAKSPASTSANASDFAADHPAFRLSIPEGEGVRRVRMGKQPLAERTTLAFPHDKHLDPKGVRSPGKGRVRLECGSCHAPDASRRGFEPVVMRRHCQECHRLEFEPAVTTREVPHGSSAEAQVVIDEFYANLALNGVKDSFERAFGVPGEGLLRRVGAPSEGERRSALSLASRKAATVGEELFATRVCKACHQVTRATEGGATRWRIAPVKAHDDWMPHARFDHKSHAQSKCADCHDAARSSKAADVSMPAIDSCRKCHGGSRPVTGKVTSNCLLCHGFHEAKHPWDPDFKPKPAARVAGALDAK